MITKLETTAGASVVLEDGKVIKIDEYRGRGVYFERWSGRDSERLRATSRAHGNVMQSSSESGRVRERVVDEANNPVTSFFHMCVRSSCVCAEISKCSRST